MTGELTTPVCPLCAAGTTALIRARRDGYAHLRCLRCGLGQQRASRPARNGPRRRGDRGGYADCAADERWHRHTRAPPAGPASCRATPLRRTADRRRGRRWATFSTRRGRRGGVRRAWRCRSGRPTGPGVAGTGSLRRWTSLRTSRRWTRSPCSKCSNTSPTRSTSSGERPPCCGRAALCCARPGIRSRGRRGWLVGDGSNSRRLRCCGSSAAERPTAC